MLLATEHRCTRIKLTQSQIQLIVKNIKMKFTKQNKSVSAHVNFELLLKLLIFVQKLMFNKSSLLLLN